MITEFRIVGAFCWNYFIREK